MEKAKQFRIVYAAMTAMFILAVVPAVALGQGGFRGPNGAMAQRVINSLPAQDLSAEELTDLLFMREEEKLARDVYAYLYRTWQARVFDNIARSEQRHFDAIGLLLEKYGLADPAQAEGVFTDPGLNALYPDLTAVGANSLLEALQVGARIEEIDIVDLKEAIGRTDNADIQTVYGNLLEGSYNHLRAFVSHLEVLGVDYAPEYLDEAVFEAIVSDGAEIGMRGNSGAGQGSGGRGTGVCPLGSTAPSGGRRSQP